ncbi:LysR family transcriptional regulator, partial [Serratia bockelmannii]|nr:LysR family transcriptional regulator [Serratia bockelmannii]
IAQYLESGELIKMFDLPIDDGRDYYLCARLDSELSQEGENLRQWLRREAAAQNVGA